MCDLEFKTTTQAGVEIPKFWGHLDHVLALTNGGEHTEDNIQLLCEKCHEEKTKIDLDRPNFRFTKLKETYGE